MANITKAPLTMAIITKQDPHLEKCLQSFHEYVSEIVIVCNDPSDNYTSEIAKKYGAILHYTSEPNDENGRIKDFALARNKSFSLATQPWVMWCDSDDIIAGMDKINEIIKIIPDNHLVMFPYEYSYNERGQVLCRHYRERLVRKDTCEWQNPIHEVLIPKSHQQQVIFEDVVFKHQRQYNPKPTEIERNLRILKDHLKKNPDDIRNHYYIGLEYYNVNDLDSAITWLSGYIEKSGWDDERAMAAYKLVEIYERKGDNKTALKWAFKSLEIKDWFESYYAICRQFSFLNNWERCVRYGQLAVAQPKTKTFLFVNEADRFDIHIFLNTALNNVGRVSEALQSCIEGLKGNPGQPYLLFNKDIYEKYLGYVPLQPSSEEKEIDPNKLDIVFATGASWERWDPTSVETTGIGGSETMLIANAKNLARLGHTVRVYASPTKEGIYENVEYLDNSKFTNIQCDVLVVSRHAQLLSEKLNVKAIIKLLWTHDVFALGATNELLLKADKILALSEWHKENLIRTHNLHPDHVLVTRNGIDMDQCQRIQNKFVSRNKYKLINSSSPDRSWPVLLDIFKELKQREPRCELHLYYGFENWKKVAANDQPQLDLIKRLEETIANTEGVHYHGRVSEEALLEAFYSSGVWTHPTWFSETSCISAMQAQAAGLFLITSPIAALKETAAGEQTTFIEGQWTSPEYKAAFIEATIKAMNKVERFFPLLESRFGLSTLANDWSKMFNELLVKKQMTPINPYQPTKTYNKRVSMTKKLNIACGPSVFPYDGWLNMDKYDFTEYFSFVSNPNVSLDGMPEHQQQLAKFLRGGGDFKFVKQDFNKPLQLSSDSFDFVYVGQAIEHMNYIHEAPVLLNEIRRVLKPGGILRMATPDFTKMLNAYTNNEMNKFADEQPPFYKELDPAAQFAILMFGSSGKECTQEKYEGHFFCYTEKSMTDLLTKSGFKDIEFNWPKCGKNKEIAMEVVDFGWSHSMIVEAVK